MLKPCSFHARLGLGPTTGLERSNPLLLAMRLCAVASGSRASSGRSGRASSGRVTSARSIVARLARRAKGALPADDTPT